MTDPIRDPADHAAAGATRAIRPDARRLMMSVAFAGTFLAAGLLMGASPSAAQTQPAPPHAATTQPAPAPAPAHAAGSGGMGGMGDKVDQTLSKVGATDDQKTKIKTIAATAMISLTALKPKVEQIPAELKGYLTGPTVDRAGLERLRVGLMADLDQASKTLFAAMADAADVLTPEQRAKLAGQMAAKPNAKP